MNNLKTILSVLALAVSFVGFSHAQKPHLPYAEAQFSQHNFRKAAVEFERVFMDKPSYEVAKKAATSWDNIYEFAIASQWWSEVVSFEKATRSDYLNMLISSRRVNPDFDPKNALINTPYRVENFPELNLFAAVSEISYRNYELVEFKELNSTESDYGLFVLKSGKRIFSSNRGDDSDVKRKIIRIDAKNDLFSDGLYHSDDKSYYGLYSQIPGQEPMRINVEGFELYHLSDPMIVSGTETIFFTATQKRLKKSDPVIYPGIYRGKFIESENKIVDIVGFPLNQTNEYGLINPVIDVNSRRLYFSSNSKNTLGGYDIFYSNYDGNWNFEKPVNLGRIVNSIGNERDPFVNGNYLYFSSDGHGGHGGLDVYRVSLVGLNAVGNLENLGSPINTPSDDFGFQIVGDRLAYMTSDRPNGLGYDDFYQLAWNEDKVLLEVLSNDQKNGFLFDGMNIELKEGNSFKKINKDELTKVIANSKTVDIRVSHSGYFRSTQKLILDEKTGKFTIYLTAIPYELDIFQSIIYYDLAKDFLRPLSKQKLDEVDRMMKKHSDIILKIESHTDSRASDSYNEKLSQRRAASATKYLKDKGIASDRVSAFWFSKSKLAVKCGDGVPCPEEDHQMNRRSELTLFAFPDRNIDYDFPEGSTAADFETSESAKRWFMRRN